MATPVSFVYKLTFIPTVLSCDYTTTRQPINRLQRLDGVFKKTHRRATERHLSCGITATQTRVNVPLSTLAKAGR